MVKDAPAIGSDFFFFSEEPGAHIRGGRDHQIRATVATSSFPQKIKVLTDGGEKKKGEAQSRKISYNFLIFNERGIMQQTDARRERETHTHIIRRRNISHPLSLSLSVGLRKKVKRVKRDKVVPTDVPLVACLSFILSRGVSLTNLSLYVFPFLLLPFIPRETRKKEKYPTHTHM